MTKKIFWEQPFADTLPGSQAYISFVGVDAIGEFVVPDATIFHPRGGGQLSDKGQLAGLAVHDVRRDPTTGDLRHYVQSVSGIRVGVDAPQAIDVDWRTDNSRWHSAGHLIAHLIEDFMPGITPTSGHHFPGEGRVECKAETFEANESKKLVALLNEKLSAAIAEDMPVLAEMVDASVRRVRIGEWQGVGCGGTHVFSTSALRTVLVRSMTYRKGVLRVSYAIDM